MSVAPIVLKRVPPGDVKSLNLDPVDDATRAQAADIIQKASFSAATLSALSLLHAYASSLQVRMGGEPAFIELAVKFGDVVPGAPYILRREQLEAGFLALPVEQQSLLQRTATRIRAFAEAQRASITDMTVKVLGGTAGHTVSPCRTAGCYAPGGRYPLPSSVLMTAITARVAGVSNVWVASPRPAPITIGAAFVAGADALVTVGGAQAIAALAYGVGDIPPCDVIVGPGNRWVTAAKSIVSGHCAIDMLAGPSECLVLADHTGKAEVSGSYDTAFVVMLYLLDASLCFVTQIIAADLLAQAEHDTDALPVLVTTHEPLIAAVEAELTRQLEALPTRAVAAVSVAKVGPE